MKKQSDVWFMVFLLSIASIHPVTAVGVAVAAFVGGAMATKKEEEG